MLQALGCILLFFVISFALSLFRRKGIRKDIYTVANILHTKLSSEITKYLKNKTEYPNNGDKQLYEHLKYIHPEYEQALNSVFMIHIVFIKQITGNDYLHDISKINDIKYSIFEDPQLRQLFYLNFLHIIMLLSAYDNRFDELVNIASKRNSGEIYKDLQKVVFNFNKENNTTTSKQIEQNENKKVKNNYTNEEIMGALTNAVDCHYRVITKEKEIFLKEKNNYKQNYTKDFIAFTRNIMDDYEQPMGHILNQHIFLACRILGEQELPGESLLRTMRIFLYENEILRKSFCHNYKFYMYFYYIPRHKGLADAVLDEPIENFERELHGYVYDTI